MRFKAPSLFHIPILVAFAPATALHKRKSNGVAIVELNARSTLQTVEKLRVCWIILTGRKSVKRFQQRFLKAELLVAANAEADE